jgi:hypothetical protein
VTNGVFFHLCSTKSGSFSSVSNFLDWCGDGDACRIGGLEFSWCGGLGFCLLLSFERLEFLVVVVDSPEEFDVIKTSLGINHSLLSTCTQSSSVEGIVEMSSVVASDFWEPSASSLTATSTEHAPPISHPHTTYNKPVQ